MYKKYKIQFKVKNHRFLGHYVKTNILPLRDLPSSSRRGVKGSNLDKGLTSLPTFAPKSLNTRNKASVFGYPCISVFQYDEYRNTTCEAATYCS